MSTQSRIYSSLFGVLLLSSFMISNAFGQTLTLSPDPLNLEPGAIASMTVTLSEPAPAGGLDLALSASPGVAVTVPAMVVVLDGSTTVVFSIMAGALEGTEQVTVFAPGFVSDSATVVVGNPAVETSCRKIIGDATHAARTYLKALDTVKRLCKQNDPACTTALSEANLALNALIEAQRLVVTNCH